jgi:ArsR family transcriptional regulator, arsenate/arsenite/antimonite-responsive transcriptional repressor
VTLSKVVNATIALVKALPVISCCTSAGSPLGDDELTELESVFRALADRHRVKILSMLLASGADELCVCNFEDELPLSQPTVSYHLKRLVEAGLLERERRGTFAYYRLADGAVERLRGLFAEPVAA